MALVEQSVWRDDAVEILHRRPSGRGQILRQILRDVLDDALLKRRRRSIGLASHGFAGRLHPFRNVGREIVGRGSQSAAAGEPGSNRSARQHAALTQYLTTRQRTLFCNLIVGSQGRSGCHGLLRSLCSKSPQIAANDRRAFGHTLWVLSMCAARSRNNIAPNAFLAVSHRTAATSFSDDDGCNILALSSRTARSRPIAPYL